MTADAVPEVGRAPVSTCADITTAVAGGFLFAKHIAALLKDDVAWDGTRWWYYEYSSHRWRWERMATHVHTRVFDLVSQHYEPYLRASADKEIVDDLLRRLNNRRYRETLMKDIAVHVTQSNFAELLDMSDNLVVCKNGVYDLQTRVFRDGRPSDMGTLSTNRTFLQEYLHDDDMVSKPSITLVKEALLFISDVLGDTDVVHSVLSSLCLSVHGGSSLQRFFMWVGCGSNGKSKLASLFRACLGEYVCTIPVTVFTQKRIEYGRACPELQRTKGRRVVFISEPSHNENLNLGIVKEITGGDSLFTRGLYEAGSEIQCKFTPVLLCNVLPNVTDTSHGAWRRLVSVNFPTTFTDNPRKENERPLDPNIDRQIAQWADAMMTYMLTDGYTFYKDRGLTIPKAVAETTNEYREECDFYTEFFREKIVKSQVPTDRCTWPHVWMVFVTWFKDSVGAEHLPKKVEVRKMLEKHHFCAKLKSGSWSGFRCV